MQQKNRGLENGFSLIELSVVLVILALLVGGILAGRHLIRSAELVSATSQPQEYKAAVSSFQQRYIELPGDLANASDYWAGVLSGDADGRIDNEGGGAAEEFRTWQMLALADAIPGQYTGQPDSMPEGKIDNSYFRLSFLPNVYGKDGHFVSLNAMRNNRANAPVLSPIDARALDLKHDDGLADSGRIMAINDDGVPGCVVRTGTGNPSYHELHTTASYLLTNEDIACKILLRMD